MINIKIHFGNGSTESGVFDDLSSTLEWVLETLNEVVDDVSLEEMDFLKKTILSIEPEKAATIGFEDYTVFYMETEQRLVSNDFSLYQDLSKITAVFPEETALAYLTTGLGAECGELQGKIAKQFRNDNPNKSPDLSGISQELGDILWFVSQLASHFNLSLGKIAQENITKLEDRQKRNVLKGSGDNR
jgi:NTP pyrophosphatase (non-canonical NTP hydrolase)